MDYNGESLDALRREGMTWPQIGERFGRSDVACRVFYHRWKKLNGAPEPTLDGLSVCSEPDAEEVFRRAVQDWREIKPRANAISFPAGPVGLAFVADLHCGGRGVDYEWMFADAERIAATPGLYVVTVGDMVDNFIIGRLVSERLKSRMSIGDEWALVRRYLSIVGPKVIAAVDGNHDAWTMAVAGLDYFKVMLAKMNVRCIYAPSELRVGLRVGSAGWRLRIRHKWRGNSIYNSTHGIERAAKWDQDFDLGVGAHDHVGVDCRSFNVAGEQGLAVKCGTYKRVDSYAISHGFAKSGPGAVAVVVFDEEPRAMTGFTNLEAACKYLEETYHGD